MKKKTVVILTILYMFFLGACSASGGTEVPATADKPLSKTGEALNTSISISLYDSKDESVLNGCFELINKYEKMFSRTDPDSEIYALNEKGQADLSPETYELLMLGLKYSDQTKGRFNIVIEPLTSLWNFSSDNPKVPSETDIKEAIKHLDYTNIAMNEEGQKTRVALGDKESGIDLGAIAKGYIADKVKEYLLGKGVKSALINLGGNVLLVGGKPDGSDFTVGLQNPFGDRNDYKEIVKAKDVSIVTSGTYERNFTENGKTYHHILNPSTGYPYDNGLVAVSIISPTSVEGDALSTSCFVLGLEEGMKLIDSLPNVHAVFVTEDGKYHYSKDYPYNK